MIIIRVLSVLGFCAPPAIVHQKLTHGMQIFIYMHAIPTQSHIHVFKAACVYIPVSIVDRRRQVVEKVNTADPKRDLPTHTATTIRRCLRDTKNRVVRAFARRALFWGLIRELAFGCHKLTATINYVRFHGEHETLMLTVNRLLDVG